MHRCLVQTHELFAEAFALSRDEARHLQTVLRVREGTEVELFDGQGRPSENLSLKEISKFRQKIETDIQWLEAVLTELRSDLTVVRELEDAALDVASVQQAEEGY